MNEQFLVTGVSEHMRDVIDNLREVGDPDRIGVAKAGAKEPGDDQRIPQAADFLQKMEGQ